MEVDLPNILKRCSSAPVFTAENGSLSNKIIENVNLPTDKYNEKNLENSVIPIQNNIIQDKIINSLTEKNNTNIISNNFSNSLPFQSNSACSSPVRSREASPAPYNIFAPRARRYSASFAGSIVNNGAVGPRLTPRVSQLRQEECVDANSREINHEREVHSAMQMSQSWEDLTLVAENWSCKSEDLNNPLQLALPPNNFLTSRQCSSPSPTSRTGMKFNLLSPSPTRRTFATRRSMSPIAMRPSQLGPVKRKFELEDGTWNINYSPPPMKKRFTENSCSPSEAFSTPTICSNLDSGINACNLTPKLNISKVNSNNMNSPSSISSPTISSPKDLNIAKELNSNEVKCYNNNDRKINGIINNENETQMEVVKSETNDYDNSKSTFIGKPTNLNVVASSSPICSNSDIRTTNLLSTASKESA